MSDTVKKSFVFLPELGLQTRGCFHFKRNSTREEGMGLWLLGALTYLPSTPLVRKYANSLHTAGRSARSMHWKTAYSSCSASLFNHMG